MGETYLVAQDRNGNVLSIEIFVIGACREVSYPRIDARSVIPQSRRINTVKVIINGSKCNLYCLNTPPTKGMHPTADTQDFMLQQSCEAAGDDKR